MLKEGIKKDREMVGEMERRSNEASEAGRHGWGRGEVDEMRE